MNDEGSSRQYPLLDGPYDELTEWEASTQETKIFYYKDMYEMENELGLRVDCRGMMEICQCCLWRDLA